MGPMQLSQFLSKELGYGAEFWKYTDKVKWTTRKAETLQKIRNSI